jgi:FtsZ-binding cell division protein ZapB
MSHKSKLLLDWLGGTDLDSLINFRPVDLREPSAWLGHIPFAYWVIEKIKPRVFVELGTHTGASYFAFCQSISANKTGTKAYAVDTWIGDEHAGFYDESVFRSVEEANQMYKSFSTLLRTTFDEASKSFEDKTIDLLHIDGLHTYEAVKHDFDTWFPKLAENAVVLFHDTNVHKDDFGVYKFWAEIAAKYPSMEFFHYHGLGVLQISKPEDSFIPESKEQQELVRGLFSGLSESMLLKVELERLTADRNGVASERDRIASERDHLASERDHLASEKDILSYERDRLVADRESFLIQRNNLAAERDSLEADLQAVMNTKIWRWTKPLRALLSKIKR